LDLQIHRTKVGRGQENRHRKGTTRSEVDDMVIYFIMKLTKEKQR